VRWWKLLELNHQDDPAVPSARAKHSRQHYCLDEEFPELFSKTGKSLSEFLAEI